jgi:hypothetical protein
VDAGANRSERFDDASTKTTPHCDRAIRPSFDYRWTISRTSALTKVTACIRSLSGTKTSPARGVDHVHIQVARRAALGIRARSC